MSFCKVMRRKLKRTGTMNLTTGKISFENAKVEDVTEPCGIPLFSNDDQKNQICRSCKDGWQVDGNYPVDEQGNRIGQTKD